jgi:hypothetical protein
VTISTPFSAKHVGSRNGNAGCDRADHEADAVADDLVCRGNALLGLAGVVSVFQNDFSPRMPPLLVDLVDGGLGAVLHLVAIGGNGPVNGAIRPMVMSAWASGAKAREARTVAPDNVLRFIFYLLGWV